MYVYMLQCTLLTMQQQELRRPLVAQRVGVGWIGLGQGSAQLSVPWNLSIGYRWQIEAVNASQLCKRLKQAQRKQKKSPVKYDCSWKFDIKRPPTKDANIVQSSCLWNQCPTWHFFIFAATHLAQIFRSGWWLGALGLVESSLAAHGLG